MVNLFPGGFLPLILAAQNHRPICLSGVKSASYGVCLITSKVLAWIFHESLAATTDMVVLPGVLGCRLLRRTIQVRLGTNTLRLPGGTPIFVVSRQQFMKYPG
jgi:hypothetical protein